MFYIGNAFSLNMVDVEGSCSWRRSSLHELEYFVQLHDVRNCIGHAVTDAIFRREAHMQGTWIDKGERASVQLSKDDLLFVVQYKGPRLEEGTTKLPEGASLEYLVLAVH